MGRFAFVHQPAALLERYSIEGELGRGGMGVVYRAVQRSLERPVALKVLGMTVAGDTEFRERFADEARLAARVAHPNVVRLYDHEVLEDGTAYIAFELVDGRTLDDVLLEAPMTSIRAVAVALGVARGLAALHAAGIVHRDLKPANVLIGADGVPRLADLGIARDLYEKRHRTRTGNVLGTPEFMAPEQLSGGPQGPAIDVYMFGCLVHALLTGQPPYTRGTVADIMRAHVAAPVPDPPPGADPLLGKLMKAALAKEPQARPPLTQIVEELAEAAGTNAAPGKPAGEGRTGRPERSSASLHAGRSGVSPLTRKSASIARAATVSASTLRPAPASRSPVYAVLAGVSALAAGVLFGLRTPEAAAPVPVVSASLAPPPSASPSAAPVIPEAARTPARLAAIKALGAAALAGAPAERAAHYLRALVHAQDSADPFAIAEVLAGSPTFLGDLDRTSGSSARLTRLWLRLTQLYYAPPKKIASTDPKLAFRLDIAGADLFRPPSELAKKLPDLPKSIARDLAASSNALCKAEHVRETLSNTNGNFRQSLRDLGVGHVVECLVEHYETARLPMPADVRQDGDRWFDALEEAVGDEPGYWVFRGQWKTAVDAPAEEVAYSYGFALLMDTTVSGRAPYPPTAHDPSPDLLAEELWAHSIVRGVQALASRAVAKMLDFDAFVIITGELPFPPTVRDAGGRFRSLRAAVAGAVVATWAQAGERDPDPRLAWRFRVAAQDALILRALELSVANDPLAPALLSRANTAHNQMVKDARARPKDWDMRVGRWFHQQTAILQRYFGAGTEEWQR